MSGRRRDEGERAFEHAMRDVERLEGRSRRRTGGHRRATNPPPPEGPRFELTTEGLCHWGRREDTSEAEIESLRAGEIAPANRLDLHGMSEEAARGHVFRFIRQAAQSGLSCVAVVHGRGMRSPDGPVLKEAVPAWLTQLPLARAVAAFASAPRDRGGDGVTLVLLRR